MAPVTIGVIPFGAVMGTVCSSAELTFLQTVAMNALVYAGAAQLASVELMSGHAAVLVVVLTGLIINLRFILYSAAIAPVVQNSGFWVKFLTAYNLTDQSYAVMSAKEDELKSNSEKVQFYLGACLAMWIVWQLSVIGGFIFGNFAPASWSLDFAIALSFIALLIPTLKNRKYVAVAIFSAIVSALLFKMPYKTGLIATASLSIAFAYLITRRPRTK